jgi:hypothetical protein
MLAKVQAAESRPRVHSADRLAFTSRRSRFYAFGVNAKNNQQKVSAMRSDSLQAKLIRRKLDDEFFQRAANGETLRETSDWLETKNITASLTAINKLRISGLFRWKMAQTGRSDLPMDISVDERDEDTLNLISKGIHNLATQAATQKEFRDLVQTFKDYIAAKTSIRTEMRADMEQMRKMGMALIDLLESPENIAKLQQADSEAKAKGLQYRLAALCESVWGDFTKAA